MKFRTPERFYLLLILIGMPSALGLQRPADDRAEIDPRQSELMPLLENADFFQLRERLQTEDLDSGPQRLFFLAASQNAFNQPSLSNLTIESLLEKVSLPVSSLIRILQTQLNNHFRLGQYRDAFNVGKKILDLPVSLDDQDEIDDVRNLLRLLELLVDVPPQTVKRSGDTVLTMPAESKRIPVEITKSQRQYLLDTGANLSVLMRSEAKELHLPIREADLRVGTSTNLEVAADIAVVETLQIGNLEFKNVVFLVFPDQTLTFPEANFRIPGIIGFPVIEAIGEIQFQKDGTVLIPGKVPTRHQRNLALQQLDPRIIVQYGSDSLICRLDTGAEATDFFEPFYQRYRSSIEALGKLQISKPTGAGGSQEVSAYVLPRMSLRVAGAEVDLEDVTIYTETIGKDREHLFCNLGLDVLDQFGGYTINFRDMALVIE
jgi:hypothetical protein